MRFRPLAFARSRAASASPSAPSTPFERTVSATPKLTVKCGASPVASANFVYCASEKGVVQVVDPAKPEGQVVRAWKGQG